MNSEEKEKRGSSATFPIDLDTHIVPLGEPEGTDLDNQQG